MVKNFKSTKDISILQKGFIYFIIRPKITKQFLKGVKNEVQNFTIVLHPHGSRDFILLIVGKKELPRGRGRSYFAFVDKIYKSERELCDHLAEKHYETKTLGERVLSAAQLLGYGKYFVFKSGQNTDLLYRLFIYPESKNSQLSFNIHEYDQFIVQVKNVDLPSLHNASKPELPENLRNIFMSHKFIPLIPINFLFYEGVELLLNSRGKETLITSEPTMTEYLYKGSKESLLSYLTSDVEHCFKTAVVK